MSCRTKRVLPPQEGELMDSDEGDAEMTTLTKGMSCASSVTKPRTTPNFFRSLKYREMYGRDCWMKRSLCCVMQPMDWRVQTEYASAGARPIPKLSLAFAREESLSHLLAVTDEAGLVSLINTSCINEGESAFEASWGVHDNAAFDISWAAHGNMLATASGDHTVRLVDSGAVRGVAILATHAGSVKAVRFAHRDVNILASGSRDGVAAIWDVRAHHQPVMRLSGIHVPASQQHTPKRRKGPGTPVAAVPSAVGTVTSVHFMPDDAVLLTGGASDGEVKMWDLRNLSSRPIPIQVLKKHSSSRQRQPGVVSLDVSATTGRILASCSDGVVYVWNGLYPDRNPIATLSGRRAASFYTKARFARDGNRIAGSADKNIYIWDVSRLPNISDESCAPQPSPPLAELSAHNTEVGGVSWSNAEENLIASCSDDGTVRLWEGRSS
eukprot:TRINITY_DN6791_c0_g2_i2.p1 TRINITY_DN6791_c0_g2~~TRINITY_DN6791_c0_g2_i2.p1  ORF type:complete len:439 (+),score=68.25 TRINITY_DN6791_c0_g2_i2:46-1362(+)